MPNCNYCNSYVSNRYERVFADEDGRVLACPQCSAIAGVAEVARQRSQE